MEFHSVATIFPMMSADQFEALKADIRANGLREPIWTHDDQIVDGRNRYNACEEVGVEPRFRQWDGAGSLKAFVVSENLIRRHLNETQRGMCAARMANMEREDTLIQNRSANLQNGEEKVSRAEAAELFRVSERTVNASAKVIEEAQPEIIELCDAGKMAASAAASVASKTPEFQKKVAEAVNSGSRGPEAIRMAKSENARVERLKAVGDAPMDSNIVVGDFSANADRVPDNSLSLIFTDPPYLKEAEVSLPHLAEFAARKLAPGGSVLFYIGHLQLSAAFKAFEGKLRHWWTCACVHAGGMALMNYYGVRVGWKPMLWFVKESRFDTQNVVVDTVSARAEKQYHDWQQAEEEAVYWIEKLCPVDGIVCDPFLGGGTTAAAAIKLNRQWIGFEIDPDTARIASGRLEGK